MEVPIEDHIVETVGGGLDGRGYLSLGPNDPQDQQWDLEKRSQRGAMEVTRLSGS